MCEVRAATSKELGYDCFRSKIWDGILRIMSESTIMKHPEFSIQVVLRLARNDKKEVIFGPKEIIFEYNDSMGYDRFFQTPKKVIYDDRSRKNVIWNMECDIFEFGLNDLKKFIDITNQIKLDDEKKDFHLANIHHLSVGASRYNDILIDWLKMGAPIFKIDGKEISYTLVLNGKVLQLGMLHLNKVFVTLYPDMEDTINNTNFVNSEESNSIWVYNRKGCTVFPGASSLKPFKKTFSEIGSETEDLSIDDRRNIVRWMQPFHYKVLELIGNGLLNDF